MLGNAVCHVDFFVRSVVPISGWIRLMSRSFHLVKSCHGPKNGVMTCENNVFKQDHCLSTSKAAIFSVNKNKPVVCSNVLLERTLRRSFWEKVWCGDFWPLHCFRLVSEALGNWICSIDGNLFDPSWCTKFSVWMLCRCFMCTMFRKGFRSHYTFRLRSQWNPLFHSKRSGI